MPRWSGREAKALREAKRLSVRDFAAYLGVNDAAVSSWEKRGEKAHLRYETQQLLDSALSSAPVDVRQRLALLLDLDTPFDPQSQAQPPTTPAAGATPTTFLNNIGARSTERTQNLLATLRGTSTSLLRGIVDAAALKTLRSFTTSNARVFILKGPPGSGKTHLAHDAVAHLSDVADIQLHSMETWDIDELDLATEILRYASVPAGFDALLTLEHAGIQLTRQCLVFIDGINACEGLEPIGRQLDAIIRQVASSDLRFVLVVRTPPEMDLTAFPIVSASIYEHPSQPAGTSYIMAEWDIATARAVWDRSREDKYERAFSDLPIALQTLARLPLYMNLIKVAGGARTANPLNAYRLIDQCVTAILKSTKHDISHLTHDLAELAHHQSPHLIPSQLTPVATFSTSPRQNPDQITAVSPLVSLTSTGEQTFAHDIIREYFLARRISALIVERGKSATTVAVLNEMAAQAQKSATAHGIFELTILSLDEDAPDLVTSLALSPTIAAETTLPRILALAPEGTRFATVHVIAAVARRCSSESNRELAQALLKQPTLQQALTDGYEHWLLWLLREFGSALWPAISEHIEKHFDFETSARFLTLLNRDTAEEAAFLAQQYFLFLGSDSAYGTVFEELTDHADWRVRMALARGLRRGPHSSASLARRAIGRLAGDADYKVRAAVAGTLGYISTDLVEKYLANFLADPNWYVRVCALDSVCARHLSTPGQSLIIRALKIMDADSTWSNCPAHIAKLRQRLRLLGGAFTPPNDTHDTTEAHDHALFALLREVSTCWIVISDNTRTALIGEGLRSHSWLVRREATALRDSDALAPPRSKNRIDARQAFRRLRGGRAIQIALDLRDLDHAVDVARAAAKAGADLIEIGDPLIKALGMRAVERIKQCVPETTIVAEMMSADWGRDQVELAAEAGADVALLIGPATIASVKAAVEAGRRLGIVIMLDVPAVYTTQSWIRDMERVGVDGFTITTNIDLGVGVRPPLTRAKAVRGWTQLPIAVSGGLSATDYAIIDSSDWDIMIVGRGVAESVVPAQAAEEIVKMVHHRIVRSPSDHQTTEPGHDPSRHYPDGSRGALHHNAHPR